jgi:hypothetical protein
MLRYFFDLAIAAVVSLGMLWSYVVLRRRHRKFRREYVQYLPIAILFDAVMEGDLELDEVEAEIVRRARVRDRGTAP